MEDRELRNLEDRIAKIELDVLSHNENDDKILKVLQEVNDTLNAFSSKRERFNQIFKKVPSILEYLSPGYIDTISLTNDFQREVVLSVEEDVKAMAEQLEEIDKLSKFLDSKKIPEVSSYEGRLLNIDAAQQQQLNQLSNSSQDLNNLLSAYNQMVSALSQTFVKWDMLLSKLEEEMF